MNTVVVQEGEIRLNSGLNEYSFGKTNYFTLLQETGLIFENNKFSKWNFESIQTFKDNVKTEKTSEDPESTERVFYCGKNPLSENAKSLLQYFTESSDNLFDAAAVVIKAMTTAAENSIKLPIVGAGGIIVSPDFEKVLFLPENIFKYSTNNLSQQQYFNEHSGWINITIKDIPAICYQRALIVYKLLTKRFPYPAIDETARNADILDKNFLPLELCIEGINLDFAKEINRALKLNSTTVSVSGKNNKGVKNEDLIVHPGFNINQLQEAWKLSNKLSISETELAEKAENYRKVLKTKIDAKRTLRRNTAAIIATACVFIFIITMTISMANRQNKQYTSKGLTSTEVIQGFFQGFNSKSSSIMTPLSKGKAPERFINKITEMYIMEKQIAGFTRDVVFANPEYWLLNVTDEERFNKVRVFGISNLTIDGMPEELDVSLYRINQHPEAVTFENNRELLQNDTITHNVEYYLLQTNPEDFSIMVQKVSEIYKLTYTNERWLITDISSTQEDIPVDTDKFKKDYFASLAANENNITKVLADLRNQYKWLPSDYAIEQEYMRIMEEEIY